MPIDFSQVKTITIPEGSVTKITDSNGNILWQGVQSEGWHTIWEGNKTCSLTKNGNNTVVSGEVPSLVHTFPGTGYKPKIRITFSYSNTNTDYNNWKNKFMVNNSAQTTISSPLTIDAVKDAPLAALVVNICIISCGSSDNKVNIGVGLKKKRDTENNNSVFSLGRLVAGNNINSYDGNFTVSFTITKIEQYY